MPWYNPDQTPWLQALGALLATCFLIFNLVPAVMRCLEESDLPTRRLDTTWKTSAYHNASNITTNLVIATVKADNISWAEELRELQSIPNFNIIRYVSDDENARYHPPKPKAREALMYFTYLGAFYDNLADVNIFVHAEESSWHMDAALQKSLIFALSRLDLEQVLEREYLNLRTTWEGSRENSCPNGFSTSKTLREAPRGEEFLMGRAFRANFPGEKVPALLSGPCCSQFAVSRAAIQSRPLKQYHLSKKFLVESNWSDQMIGRTWEHMWPWLFKKQAEDCHSEWRMLCMMYGVCFHSQEELQRYNGMWDKKASLKAQPRLWREIWQPRRLRKVEIELEDMLQQALDHGSDAAVREEAGKDLT